MKMNYDNGNSGEKEIDHFESGHVNHTRVGRPDNASVFGKTLN